MKLKRDRLFYREDDFTRYQPAGHTGTVNRRIVGPEQGSKHFEVELGIIKPRQSVSCHFLPRIDEFCDMLHDTSNVIIGGETCEVGPDEGCFFVVDTPHDFTAT
ncbi:MAG: cupin domain-containing protein, partial [Gammaproteobacteria bacterium]|nr:cupin domain-containing protein [Gammaproteobacteria bacterium]